MSKKRNRGKQRASPARNIDTAATQTPSTSIIPSALTLDAFSNPLARLGAGTPDAMQFTQYTRQNFTAQYNTLTNLYRENWVVKKLIDVVPEDMTKSWYRITSQLAPDYKQQITQLERKTHIRERVLEGLKWGRLYGGAVAVIVIDGHDDILDQPLNYEMSLAHVMRSSVRELERRFYEDLHCFSECETCDKVRLCPVQTGIS